MFWFAFIILYNIFFYILLYYLFKYFKYYIIYCVFFFLNQNHSSELAKKMKAKREAALRWGKK